jgi:hypothetical protein
LAASGGLVTVQPRPLTRLYPPPAEIQKVKFTLECSSSRLCYTYTRTSRTVYRALQRWYAAVLHCRDAIWWFCVSKEQKGPFRTPFRPLRWCTPGLRRSLPLRRRVVNNKIPLYPKAEGSTFLTPLHPDACRIYAITTKLRTLREMPRWCWLQGQRHAIVSVQHDPSACVPSSPQPGPSALHENQASTSNNCYQSFAYT